MTFKNHHFLPRSIIPWIAFSLKIVFVKRRQKNTISARKFLLIVHFLSNYIQISLFCVWNITSRVENSELPQARETPSGKERIQNLFLERFEDGFRCLWLSKKLGFWRTDTWTISKDKEQAELQKINKAYWWL